MAICKITGKEYDPETVEIPKTIPDDMCGISGFQLTPSQIVAENKKIEEMMNDWEANK